MPSRFSTARDEAIGPSGIPKPIGTSRWRFGIQPEASSVASSRQEPPKGKSEKGKGSPGQVERRIEKGKKKFEGFKRSRNAKWLGPQAEVFSTVIEGVSRARPWDPIWAHRLAQAGASTPAPVEPPPFSLVQEGEARSVSVCETYLRPPGYTWSTVLDRNVWTRHLEGAHIVRSPCPEVVSLPYFGIAEWSLSFHSPSYQTGSAAMGALDARQSKTKLYKQMLDENNESVKLFGLRHTNPDDYRQAVHILASVFRVSVKEMTELLEENEENPHLYPSDEVLLSRLALRSDKNADLLKKHLDEILAWRNMRQDLRYMCKAFTDSPSADLVAGPEGPMVGDGMLLAVILSAYRRVTRSEILRPYRHSEGALDDPIDAFAFDMCQMCGLFGCEIHRELPAEFVARATKRPYEDAEEPQARRDYPCGPHCCKKLREDGLTSGPGSVIWSDDERMGLSTISTVWKGINPCELAQLFPARECYQIARALRTATPTPDDVTKSRNDPIRPARCPKPSTSGVSELLDFGDASPPKDQLKSHKTIVVPPTGEVSSTLEYIPCKHNGKCKNNIDCTCHSGGNACDRFCACPPTCSNRWRGCNCIGQCGVASECPCREHSRECDPAVCHCRTHNWTPDPETARPDPPCVDVVDQGEGDAPTNRVQARKPCDNTAMWRDHRKRTFVGPSQVAGWGLFVGEDVAPGDCLGEYKGELLSMEEMEVRSTLSNISKTSYVFDLDVSLWVDNAGQGNKTRYINEPSGSSTPQGPGSFPESRRRGSRGLANADAEVRFVLGSKRLGIFARRRMKAGQEVLIDYGENYMLRDYGHSRPISA